MKLANKRILVVGMARSGVAAAQLLLENGATPVLSDRKPEDAFGGELDALRGTACEFRLAEDPVRLLSEVDGLVISPGVPIDAPVVLAAKEQGIPMVGELELAWSLLQGEVLAISGTNGKTTTTTLLGKIFENAGRVTHVAGNIGSPLSAVAMKSKKDDVVVVEVSSFQLESIKTFHPHVAALLNITEDHLNRHGTQPVENGAFVEDGKIVWQWNGARRTICDAEQILIPGPHNLENALAATAMACAMGVPAPVIRHTLQSFSGVEHRIEKVRVFQGVTYINDSKGTNVDSTIKAVQSMKAPTVLLLGGYDKHTDFMPLCREIIASGRIDDVVVMGETARQIREQLEEAGYDRITQAYSLRDAVDKARALAVSGGNVLLSPACASFDMFRDYEHRGAVFKEIVNALN